MLAGAIHREYFLLQCLKKEIATTKELDLRQLGKVIIFRDRQTNKTFLLYIDADVVRMDTLEDLQTSGNAPDFEAREGVEDQGL